MRATFVLIDSRRGVMPIDLDWMSMLRANRVPFKIVSSPPPPKCTAVACTAVACTAVARTAVARTALTCLLHLAQSQHVQRVPSLFSEAL